MQPVTPTKPHRALVRMKKAPTQQPRFTKHKSAHLESKHAKSAFEEDPVSAAVQS
jgi:hypothetical protein